MKAIRKDFYFMMKVFTAEKIKEVVSQLMPYKIIEMPVHLDRGYGNENWLITTDHGKFNCKIGPKNIPINKWRSVIKAVEIAKRNGIKTNDIILFNESCPLLDNRVLRIYNWIEGYSIDKIKTNPAYMKKLFYEFGQTVKKLHSIHFNFFGSRIDQSEAHFITWEDYLHYRIKQIHERALHSNKFHIETLNQLWKHLFEDINIVSPLVTPSFTHRDLHLDNLIVSDKGDLIAFIDFDGSESWDPIGDFNKLKWHVFNKYPEYEEDFYSGYGKPDKMYKYFDKRLRIVEVIHLINTIAQIDDPEPEDMLSSILKAANWENPL